MIRKAEAKELKSFITIKENNPFLNYIVYEDKDIIGYIKYSNKYDDIDIEEVFVLEDHRNKK